MCGATVEALTVASQQDRAFGAFTDRDIDGSTRSGDERDHRWFVALADNPKRSVPAIEADVFFVCGACAADAQSVQAEQDRLRSVLPVQLGVWPGRSEHADPGCRRPAEEVAPIVPVRIECPVAAAGQERYRCQLGVIGVMPLPAASIINMPVSILRTSRSRGRSRRTPMSTQRRAERARPVAQTAVWVYAARYIGGSMITCPKGRRWCHNGSNLRVRYRSKDVSRERTLHGQLRRCCGQNSATLSTSGEELRMGFRESLRRQLYEHLVSQLGLQRWSAFEIADANYPIRRHVSFMQPTVSTASVRRLTNQCVDGKITLDELWYGVWGVSRREFTEQYTASKGIPLTSLPDDDPIWAELDRTYLRERPARSIPADGTSIMCGGGFSIMPSGFPFPVPDQVRLTCTQAGIEVNAGSAPVLWEWADLLDIKAETAPGSQFVVGTLVTSETFRLMTRRGGDDFAATAKRRLSDWEARLSVGKMHMRAIIRGQVDAVHGAKRARREAAERLPRASQPECRGYVVARVDGRQVGGGPIFLDESVVVFHDASGNHRLAAVPYNCIGELKERQTDGRPEFVGQCSHPGAAEIVFAPQDREWLDTYSTYVNFKRAHDLIPVLDALREAMDEYKRVEP